MKPAPFADFCRSYGFELEPAQRALCSVSFDRVQLRELGAEERAIAVELFGAVEEIPALAFEVVVWVKGARIGGSRMAAMRLYQLAHVTTLELAPGESAFGLIVGPDLRLAAQAFRYVLGAAKMDEAAGRVAIIREGATALAFERHDGQIVTIECLPATAGGSAVRARTLVGAIMTEAAFFRDADYAINDVEVYRALGARIVPGGQLILESTPWSEEGLVYELFTSNHGAPTTALAAKCPTTTMRRDARTRALVAREEQRDPDNAAREFGAAFMPGGSNLFFDPRLIDAAMGGIAILEEEHAARP